MESEPIETRVARGAAWLDSICPDWRGRIKVDKLDLANPRSCVLGQLFTDDSRDPELDQAGYWYVLHQLADGDGCYWAEAYGFKTHYTDHDGGGGSFVDGAWDRLRDAWVDHLESA